MLIRGVSIASINPPIYRESLLDFANHLCVINPAVCMIMPQLFNSPLIKTQETNFVSCFFCVLTFIRPSLSLPSSLTTNTLIYCKHSFPVFVVFVFISCYF